MPLHLAPNLDHGWRVGDRPGLLDLAAIGGRERASGRPARPGARRRHVVPARRRARRGRAAPASDVELRRLGAEVAGPGWRVEEAGGVRRGHIQVMRELGRELAGLADRLQRPGGRSPDDGEGGPVVPLRSGA